MFGKLMSISDNLMDRYYGLLLGRSRNLELHPMEAKLDLAAAVTARYHGEPSAAAARADWQMRFSKRNLAAAELPCLDAALFPAGTTTLAAVALAFERGFGIARSNGEIRRQFITTGAVQLNGAKLTDPAAPLALEPGDLLRLSKKHAVKIG